MKVDNRFISIPPYISTGWASVESIRVHEGILFITLHDGEQVKIPQLSSEQVSLIFNAHAAFMEDEQQFMEELDEDEDEKNSLPFPFGDSISLGNGDENSMFSMQISGLINTPGVVGISMQHNPRHANAPDLPKEILQRITSISQIIGAQNMEMLPDPQPQCNCPFCQISNAIKRTHISERSLENEHKEQEVRAEELQFNQWEIALLEPDLFSVKNKLDHTEIYKVCLKPKVGCTCGEQGCEHIVAVLKSPI